MGDFDLTGLDPRRFEHLVQALAQNVIGADVTPFGDGPDGGREATFDGPMHYPSFVQPWDGYLVIQCKFQQKPGSTKEQGKWALKQLEADLKKFLDPSRTLRKPKYYLFVTNVVLTPVPETGSKDRVLALMESYRERLGLKGYAVWDYDKLCRLLDANPGVRQTYAGSITPGDILSIMMDRVPGVGKSFWYLMPLFLQREFVGDLYARLEQFNDSGDRPISLGNVFVDLPAFEQYDPEPPDESDPEGLPSGVIAELLEAGAQELKSSALAILSASQSGTSGVPEPGRFVIVGGPGQGKSTVGQFLCQLYRAAILRDLPESKLEQDALNGIRKLERDCAEARITLPATKRFPVRIVLDRFANALAERKCASLLGYIASRASRPDTPCDANDLREWLRGHAWLLVLDGLDEVPATSNRKQVLDEVVEFWREVKALDADVFVVATTRPQGYSNDFSHTVYQHRYLALLSPGRALSYARRLIEARYVDSDQKQRVLNRLTQACYHDTTARLMRSPLQVTIMAALVERVGRAPQDRWSLFDKYYDMFYSRECEKETPTSRILLERKQDVNAIHQRVGLLLQTESERPGATESRLPMERFVQVVRARLSEEGHEGAELEKRTHEIIDAAVARLVFLVNVDESIGFEIRSLQEFMAAEGLMDGTDNVIQERLAAIAPCIHWRNVFVFAAGHCFSARPSLRDTICSICAQLNDQNTDDLAGSALAGSRLAREILVEGVVREQPKYARYLMHIASELMSVPIDEENARLAAAHDQTLDPVFQQEIRERLGRPKLGDRLGAWTVLRVLLDKGIAWAEDLAQQHWPLELPSQIEIMSMKAGPLPSAWTTNMMTQVIVQASPREVISVISGFDVLATVEDAVPSWLLAVRRVLRFENYGYMIVPFKLQGVSSDSLWSLRSIQDYTGLAPLKDMPATAPDWLPLRAAGCFFDDPSPAMLAHLMRGFSSIENYPAIVFRTLPWYIALSMPWPLAACLEACATAEECAAIAERVERGDLGQHSEWELAEERWQEGGFTPRDWEYSAGEGWPFDTRIGSIGFPIGTYLWPSRFSAVDWPANYAWFEGLKGQKEGARAAIMMLNALQWLGESDAQADVTPTQLRALVEADPRTTLSGVLIQGARMEDIDDAWVNTFEELGRLKSFDVLDDPFFGLKHSPLAQALAEAYARKPDRINLLTPLALLSVEGAVFMLSPKLLQPEALTSDEEKTTQLYVRLAQGAWDDAAEFQRLLHRFACVQEEKPTVELALQALRNCSRNGGLRSEEAERLVLALHHQIMDKSSTQTWRTFAFLSAALARRLSPLQEREKWERLKLPGLNTGEFPAPSPSPPSPRRLAGIHHGQQ